MSGPLRNTVDIGKSLGAITQGIGKRCSLSLRKWYILVACHHTCALYPRMIALMSTGTTMILCVFLHFASWTEGRTPLRIINHVQARTVANPLQTAYYSYLGGWSVQFVCKCSWVGLICFSDPLLIDLQEDFLSWRNCTDLEDGLRSHLSFVTRHICGDLST